ncbi:hypothetical protein KQY30_05510 [Streptomyces sp. GMY02]|uniref:hypothetical protein n=1 Tax=Streptomyces sp. GMY02 TaxID=1333528 RepID=UPI001C2BC2B1|nr:hypothetical protein [Streptomyces sp. GMY02]QXE33828.1 hypothetical protein KQY30_05510 [Streptomyces sp. GMY02]
MPSSGITTSTNCPTLPTISYARDLLSTAGVLPQRNEAVERLPRWADAVLRRLGLGGLAGRNTARLALAADVPASILAVLTGTSIDNAADWTNFVKRDWTGYISSRRSDS